MKRLAITVITVIFAIAALPCFAGPLGDYRSENGKHVLTFTADGKVKTRQFGKALETTYKTKGRTVSFKFPGGIPLNFTIEDSTLTHPGLQTYRKV